MIVILIGVAFLIFVLTAVAGIIGTVLGAIFSLFTDPTRKKFQHFQEPPSGVRLIESKIYDQDLEGWNGEDELDI
jgi:hypothetical protein